MKQSLFPLLVIVGILSVVFFPQHTILAHPDEHEAYGTETEDQYKELQDREQKRSELQKKILNAKAQEKTLANQIAYLENQIELTQLEQRETQNSIVVLQNQLTQVTGDIGSLSEKLQTLSESIDELYEVLSKRVRSSYQVESAWGTEMILDTRNLRKSVLQLAYLERLQKEDNRLLSRMDERKDTYENQKLQLETLKTEKETLKGQLEGHTQTLENQELQLNNQQSAKGWLLQVTKNEERQYQGLLAQVEEEIRAIRAALTSLGTKIGDVKSGDIIGHVGNTGCSTGPHLHFGYYIGGAATDPMGNFNNGTFVWPLEDPLITQGFNDSRTRAWYQANFGMSGHNGIDFVDGTVGNGAPIKAVKDGVAYAVNDSQACYLTGTVGKGVRVDHYDGTKTIYWHIQ